MSPARPRRGELPPAVVLGGGENTISIARSLGALGAPVHLLGDGLASIYSRSRFFTSVVPVEQGDDREEVWEEWLAHGPPGAVVLAGCDPGLEFVSRHRAALEAQGYCPVEARDDVTLAMLDKWATYELAQQAGIEVPRTMPVPSGSDLAATVAMLGFPCALKPRSSYRYTEVFGGKAIVVDGPEALGQAYRSTERAGIDMMVTEIIPGVDDSYCSYYTYMDDRGEPLLHFTKQKLRQLPIGFGGGVYHVSRWDAEVAASGLQFLRGVGLRGIGNVEFKRDRRDGRLKLIECNPRVTAADALLRRAGVDLPRLAYLRAIGREAEPPVGFRDGVRQWYPLADFRAFLSYRRAGRLTTRRWLGSLLHVQHFPLFDLRDPLPTLANGVRLFRRALRRVRRRGPRARAATP